jgi:tetratricopeptide (TPR) repeat protein
MGALGLGALRVTPVVVAVAWLSAGCASLRSVPTSLLPPELNPFSGLSAAKSPTTALNANVPTVDELAAPYRAQAKRLERAGRLRQAVEAWTTALALAPHHEPSRQALKRLRKRIDREVAEHLRRGWHALARQDAAEAQRAFLAGLALDPDSRPARDAMRAVPGASVVAALPAGSSMGGDSLPQPAVSGPPRAVTARLIHTPLPDGQEVEAEKPGALYAAAQVDLAARRDDEAYRSLVRLERSSPGYRDSAALLRDVRARLVRQRYQEGLRLLREERLEEAIEQWRGVLEIDATHADARRSIEQAERMLQTLAAQPKR